jgi:hypothetical protein
LIKKQQIKSGKLTISNLAKKEEEKNENLEAGARAQCLSTVTLV